MSVKPVVEIIPGVWLLAEEMFPLYLVLGESSTLIDCAVLPRAESILARIDRVLAGLPLRRIALTHSHYDHVGALPRIQQVHRAPVVASARTQEVLANPKAVAFIDHLNQEFKRMVGDASVSAFTRPADITAVKEGDRISLGPGRWLEVYETPGHTRCSISFLLLPERVLFPGDAAGVVERDGRIKPLFLSHYGQYESSLRKISALRPSLLAMPHNAPIRGTQRASDFLGQALRETQRARDEILQALAGSDDFQQIAVNLLAREYPKPSLLGPREAFLINLTAMVRAVHAEFSAPEKKIEN